MEVIRIFAFAGLFLAGMSLPVGLIAMCKSSHALLGVALGIVVVGMFVSMVFGLILSFNGGLS